MLAAVRLYLSNGRMEGLNNKIGVIKHRVYDFHSFAALSAMSTSAAPIFASNHPFGVEEHLVFCCAFN